MCDLADTDFKAAMRYKVPDATPSCIPPPIMA